MGVLISAILALIISALILILVDKLNMGLSVGGFLNAIIAALGIAIFGAIVMWVLGLLNIDVSMTSGIVGVIVYFLVAALAIWLAAKLVPGFETAGYVGAIVAALAIAVIMWLLEFIFDVPNLLLPS